MTTNLLSVIEQQQKALKHILAGALSLPRFAEAEANAAIAAGQQALTTQGEAKAWDEGYAAGVNDERISESSIGVAGFDAKVNPARENPYRRTYPQATEPAPSTAGERDRTIVSLPIPASASDLKSDIAEIIQSHKYKGLRSIEVLGVFQFIGAEIISGSNS